MAIIKSIAVGKARNSAGNVTFRTVRGRTIMSEKVTANPSITRNPSQELNIKLFGLIARFMRAHASSIEVSFDKSKYGSQRNYMQRINSFHLRQAFIPLAESVDEVWQASATEIEDAIGTYAAANPATILRVKRTGYDLLYLTGNWDDNDNPDTPTPIFAEFKINGAVVAEGALNVVVDQGDTMSVEGSGLENAALAFTFDGVTGEIPHTTALSGITNTNAIISGSVVNAYSGKFLRSVVLNGITVREFDIAIG